MTKKLFRYKWLALATIVLLHIFLLGRLVFFPYPELFVYSYLTKRGLLPYAQIIDQHFPGAMFFPVNLATLGIDTITEYRVVQFSIVALTHILLFIASKKTLKSYRLSLVANFLYFLWQPFYEGYVLWIDIFVVPVLLASFILLQKWITSKDKTQLMLGGMFIGFSFLFKQVTFPLAFMLGLFVLYKTKSISRSIPFAVGLSLPLLGLFIYILRIGVWEDFYYWTLTFNLTVFAETGRKYPDLVSIIRSVPIFLPAFLIFSTLKKTKSASVFLVVLFFIGSLFFAYARYDFVHLQPALPFAILLTIFIFQKAGYFVKAFLFMVILLATTAFLPSFYKANLSERVLFFGDTEMIITEKVRLLTDKDDKIFALGTMPHIYYLTDRLPPGNIFVFQFPWFTKVAEGIILDGILADPPRVVVRDRASTTAGINLVSYMPHISSYVEKHYQYIDEYNGIEILVRR